MNRLIAVAHGGNPDVPVTLTCHRQLLTSRNSFPEKTFQIPESTILCQSPGNRQALLGQVDIARALEWSVGVFINPKNQPSAGQ